MRFGVDGIVINHCDESPSNTYVIVVRYPDQISTLSCNEHWVMKSTEDMCFGSKETLKICVRVGPPLDRVL